MKGMEQRFHFCSMCIVHQDVGFNASRWFLRSSSSVITAVSLITRTLFLFDADLLPFERPAGWTHRRGQVTWLVCSLSFLWCFKSTWVKANYHGNPALIMSSSPNERDWHPLDLNPRWVEQTLRRARTKWERLLTEQVCLGHKLTHAEYSPRGPLELWVSLCVSDMKHGPWLKRKILAFCFTDSQA